MYVDGLPFLAVVKRILDQDRIDKCLLEYSTEHK